MALGQICTLPKKHLGRHLAQFLERTVTMLLKVSLKRTEAEYATKLHFKTNIWQEEFISGLTFQSVCMLGLWKLSSLKQSFLTIET